MASTSIDWNHRRGVEELILLLACGRMDRRSVDRTTRPRHQAGMTQGRQDRYRYRPGDQEIARFIPTSCQVTEQQP